MSTEKNSMLRVRLTQRQSDELDSIIGELQTQMPEASVTTSSIARYALEKYVRDHIAKRDETKENCSLAVHYMVGEILEPLMMKMASLMKPKKPEVRDGE